MATVKRPVRQSGARGVGVRFGWRVWPGASGLGSRCTCGDPLCLYVGPHPLFAGECNWSTDSLDRKQEAHAWRLWPNAIPLLVADNELDLVGAEIEDALAILDALEADRSLLRPVVIHRDIAAFIVAPHEHRYWRQYMDYGRGVQLLPWIPMPSEKPDVHLRWQVPPTETNSSPLPTFSELSAAFVRGLGAVRLP